MYMDYTFLMEDDSYIHFEFQTTDKGIDDLMRFRTYEALLNHQTKKEVITYVVYSGDIKNPISEYNCGINTYKVNAISMVNEDGDKVFDEIIDKLSSGKDIDKQDIRTAAPAADASGAGSCPPCRGTGAGGGRAGRAVRHRPGRCPGYRQRTGSRAGERHSSPVRPARGSPRPDRAGSGIFPGHSSPGQRNRRRG